MSKSGETKGGGRILNARPKLPPIKRTEPQESRESAHNDHNDQQSIHVDELLCFVQNKVRTSLGDFIVKLCSDFYSDAAVTASKEKLFQDTEDLRPSRMRYIKRIGENKKIQDLQDILNVFRALPGRSTLSYVARDLGNLPPLSAFDNDVIAVYRELEQLKSSFKTIMDMRSDLATLTSDVRELKSIALPANVPANSDNVQESHEPSLDSSVSDINARGQLQDSGESDDEEESDENKGDSTSEWVTLDAISVSSDVSIADALTSTPLPNSTQSAQIPPRNVMTSPRRRHRRQEQSRDHGISGQYPPAHEDDKIIVGTGHSGGLKVVQPRRQLDFERQSRRITGVFLSRLAPSTACAQIATRVRRETGLNVNPEKMKSKYDSYSSFYIRAERRDRSILMDSNIWPTGTLVKPFFS